MERLLLIAIATVFVLAFQPKGNAQSSDGGPATTTPAPPTEVATTLPPESGRVSVTIYEFRSSFPNVSGRAATDMFKTALVQSGRFQVVERSRLADGVMREKQLNADGLASGTAAKQQLRGARYIFEGTVSEVNVAESQRSGSVSIAGVNLGSASTTDSIAIDVRVVDAGSGDVLDAITVRKQLKASETSIGVSGGALFRQGRNSAAIPDIKTSQRKADGADATLRAAIDDAVARLAARFDR